MYPKVLEDFVTKKNTQFGGAVSVITGLIVLYLLVSSIWAYVTVTQRDHMAVDTERRTSKLVIEFNLTMHALDCSQCVMDVMDVTGEQQLNLHGQTWLQRLDRTGRHIGAPFHHSGRGGGGHGHGHGHRHAAGAAAAAAQHRRHQKLGASRGGCMTWGSFTVNKVAGNMHLALGHARKRNVKHVHQFMLKDLHAFNSSHTINYLTFGKHYPGVVNPLDGTTHIIEHGTAHFQYFIKVVPTTYVDSRGVETRTNQFSVTSHNETIATSARHAATTRKIPGVVFIYDISPFMIRVMDESQRLSTFLISLCAIVGGTVSLAGILISCVSAIQRLRVVS
jgi:hypothetical protein